MSLPKKEKSAARKRQQNARGGSKKKRRVLRAVLTLQDGKCWWCGKSIEIGTRNIKMLATTEHIKPFSDGGKNGIDNCVAACLPCNKARGTKSYWQTHPTMQETHRFRLLGASSKEIMEVAYPGESERIERNKMLYQQHVRDWRKHLYGVTKSDDSAVNEIENELRNTCNMTF